MVIGSNFTPGCRSRLGHIHDKGWCRQILGNTYSTSLYPLMVYSILLSSLCRALWRILRAKNEEFGGLKCIFTRWNKPMKIKHRVIVRCKRPIKIEKPLQCLMTLSYSAGERNTHLTDLLSIFFFSVIFSLPSKVIIIAIQFVFGHKNNLGPSQSSLQPSPNGSG